MQAIRSKLKRSLSEESESWRPALVAHVVSLAVGYLLLLWLNRDQWFWADEWDFLTDRGSGPQDMGLFQPHNEHWSTIPILIYRGLFSIFGLRTYMPYIAVLLILHVAVVHLLWRIMRGSNVDPWIATGLSAMFLAFGAGFENLLWAFQIGFVGSVLCGLGQVMLADHSGSFDRRDIAGWGMSLAGLMFSGIGVPMTAAAGVVALIRRGWRGLVLTVAPATVVYLVWLVTVGREGLGTHPFPTAGMVLRLPLYVAIGVRETIESMASVTMGIQAIVPIVLLLAAVGLMRERSKRAAAVACAVGSVIMFAITGIGRIALYGAAIGAGSPRYVYIAAALLLPLMAIGLTNIARASTLARVAVLLFVALGVVTSLRALQAHAEDEGQRKQFIRSTALAAASPSAVEGPLLGSTPLPRDTVQFSPLLQLDELVALREEGALPAVGSVSPEAHLQAATNLQVSLTGEPRLASEDSSGVLVAGSTASIDSGCVPIDPDTILQRPTVVIAVSEPSSIGIRSEIGGGIEVLIRRDGIVSPVPRNFSLTDGMPAFLNVGVLESEVIVRLPSAGQTTLCNLRLP